MESGSAWFEGTVSTKIGQIRDFSFLVKKGPYVSGNRVLKF